MPLHILQGANSRLFHQNRHRLRTAIGDPHAPGDHDRGDHHVEPGDRNEIDQLLLSQSVLGMGEQLVGHLALVRSCVTTS